MILGVEIKGMDKLRRKVNALPKVLNDSMWSATYEITELIRSAAELRLASSMKYSSGELLGSLKNDVVLNSENNIVGYVWTDKKQGVFRELGTGPNGEASTKELPEGFTPVYTTRTWFIPVSEVAVDLNAVYGIPKITIQGQDFYMTRGQPARPFLYPSFKEVMEQAEEIYKEHVQKGLRGLK
ncbi:MAG: HK97 gp10 family phage protein [Streptococcaceae bacterium]|jgi:hypothetical protein|nr:HK97 gp10 family phage protein [Streptococcaceae bacterium]